MKVMDKLDDTKPAPPQLGEPLLEGGLMVVKQLECSKKFDGDVMVATMGGSKT